MKVGKKEGYKFQLNRRLNVIQFGIIQRVKITHIGQSTIAPMFGIMLKKK